MYSILDMLGLICAVGLLISSIALYILKCSIHKLDKAMEFYNKSRNTTGLDFVRSKYADRILRKRIYEEAGASCLKYIVLDMTEFLVNMKRKNNSRGRTCLVKINIVNPDTCNCDAKEHSIDFKNKKAQKDAERKDYTLIIHTEDEILDKNDGKGQIMFRFCKGHDIQIRSNLMMLYSTDDKKKNNYIKYSRKLFVPMMDIIDAYMYTNEQIIVSHFEWLDCYDDFVFSHVQNLKMFGGKY